MNKKDILESIPKNEKPIYDDDDKNILREPIGTAEQGNIDNIVSFYTLEIIEELRNKISKGKIRDTEKEKIRIKYYNTFLTAIQTYNKIDKKDRFVDMKILNNFYGKMNNGLDDQETIIMNFQQKKQKQE